MASARTFKGLRILYSSDDLFYDASSCDIESDVILCRVAVE